MGKKMNQFAAALLGAAICLTGVVWAADPPAEELMRVGLFYDTSALPGANLENSQGTGYRFGYFDGGDVFYQLGYTGETKLSVVKTQNVYFDGGNYVDTPSSLAVGCYHVQLPTAYTTFEEAQNAAGTVAGGFPAWIDGTYYVRAGSYLTSDAAASAAAALGVPEAKVAGTSAYGVSVVRTGTSTVLFQYDGGEALPFAIKPGLDDSVKTVTWFKGYRYYGAFQYQRRGGGNLTVVNYVPMEDYISCVISQEMSASWPLEALKAQAVCARNYAMTSMDNHRNDGFELCGTTHCQAYIGMARTSETTERAAAETNGLFAWYDGKLAQTYYFSCDGGATESASNVWPNGKDLPYLKGVADPYEPTVADKTGRYNWTKTFSKAELKSILNGKGYACSDIVDFYIAETTPTGNVFKITFVDANGKSWSFVNTQKEYCRTLLGLDSIRYTITGGGGTYFVDDKGESIRSVSGVYAVDGKGQVAQTEGMPYVITASGTEQMVPTVAGDSFTITGSGWGHNVGMSQWGAYAMAQQGKTFDEILKFYYTGIEVR